VSEFESGSEFDVVRIMLKGGLVPLLGAGVNACGRAANSWNERDKTSLPTGAELADYLAREFGAPVDLAQTKDLIRISQFIDSVKSMGDEMYETLTDIFVVEYEPGPVHQFLARSATILRESGQLQVILSTNYDDLLERALERAGEPYDLITYIASGPQEHRGRFMHWAPGESPTIIEDGNVYSLGEDKRTVIVKLHGAVQRRPPESNGTPEQLRAPSDSSEEANGDSEDANKNYVITEDHYIEYLTHTDISSQLPIAVTEKLRNSSYLFLGYGMKDWNLRAILRRLWGDSEKRGKPSWAIQKDVDRFEKAFWEKRTVTIVEFDLEEYIKLLHNELDKRLAKEAV
jgi:hypothetical protein